MTDSVVGRVNLAPFYRPQRLLENYIPVKASRRLGLAERVCVMAQNEHMSHVLTSPDCPVCKAIKEWKDSCE